VSRATARPHPSPASPLDRCPRARCRIRASAPFSDQGLDVPDDACARSRPGQRLCIFPVCFRRGLDAQAPALTRGSIFLPPATVALRCTPTAPAARRPSKTVCNSSNPARPQRRRRRRRVGASSLTKDFGRVARSLTAGVWPSQELRPSSTSPTSSRRRAYLASTDPSPPRHGG
jgi:hypothetical protein